MFLYISKSISVTLWRVKIWVKVFANGSTEHKKITPRLLSSLQTYSVSGNEAYKGQRNMEGEL